MGGFLSKSDEKGPVLPISTGNLEKGASTTTKPPEGLQTPVQYSVTGGRRRTKGRKNRKSRSTRRRR